MMSDCWSSSLTSSLGPQLLRIPFSVNLCDKIFDSCPQVIIFSIFIIPPFLAIAALVFYRYTALGVHFFVFRRRHLLPVIGRSLCLRWGLTSVALAGGSRDENPTSIEARVGPRAHEDDGYDQIAEAEYEERVRSRQRDELHGGVDVEHGSWAQPESDGQDSGNAAGDVERCR